MFEDTLKFNWIDKHSVIDPNALLFFNITENLDINTDYYKECLLTFFMKEWESNAEH